MGSSRSSNAALLARTVSALRKEGRIDEMGQVLARAAQTGAELLDAVSAPDSDVAVYARGRVLGTYVHALVQMATRVTRARPGDPFDQMLETMAANIRAEEQRAAAYAAGLDAAEAQLAADPATWPDVS